MQSHGLGGRNQEFTLSATLARRGVERDTLTRAGKFAEWAPMFTLGGDLVEKPWASLENVVLAPPRQRHDRNTHEDVLRGRRKPCKLIHLIIVICYC